MPPRPTLDSVVLLAGPVEANYLPPRLKAYNPALTVHTITTAAELTSMEPSLLERARLIAFATDVLVPADILHVLGHGAFNFHPGPPHYPGWAPVHFALYDQANEFGATFHVMTDRVDTGPILDVEMFPIEPGATVASLGAATYAALLKMFARWAEVLATEPAPLTPRRQMAWSNRKMFRSRYRALCQLPLDISKEELTRRLRVFGDSDFGISPSVTLHGVEFRLASKDSVPAEPNERSDPPRLAEN